MFRWIRRWSDARAARRRVQASFMPRQLEPVYDPEHAYRKAFGETFAEHEARRMMWQFSDAIAQAAPTGTVKNYAKTERIVVTSSVPGLGLGVVDVPINDKVLSNSALEVYDDSTIIHQALGDMSDDIRYADDSNGDTKVHEDIVDEPKNTYTIEDTNVVTDAIADSKSADSNSSDSSGS